VCCQEAVTISCWSAGKEDTSRARCHSTTWSFFSTVGAIAGLGVPLNVGQQRGQAVAQRHKRRHEQQRDYHARIPQQYDIVFISYSKADRA
jgi:hypothetical protein